MSLSDSITRSIARWPRPAFIAWTALLAFTTYFCAYAFRKPFQAALYQDLTLFGMNAKMVFVLSQTIGYTLSKFAGIKFCSEVQPRQRMARLLGVILIAEGALVAFGALPPALKPVPMFVNGLTLGLVWGLVVLYIEGRRFTEILFAGLSCSYIVSSGIVKDIALWLMESWRIDPFWMPAATGALFLPLLVLAVWLLNLTPPPDASDIAQRNRRAPMNRAERRAFFAWFAPGIILQLLIYTGLTALRDYRDTFAVDILTEQGTVFEKALLTRLQLMVAFAAMLAIVLLNLFRVKRTGIIPNMIMMMLGTCLILVSTWLFGREYLNGFWWMVLLGMGGYLAYVPSDTIFYDRLLATSPFSGTAVFMAYVMDASGYSGSIVLQLLNQWLAPGLSRTEFLMRFCYGFSAIALVLLMVNTVYFIRRSLFERPDPAPPVSAGAPAAASGS